MPELARASSVGRRGRWLALSLVVIGLDQLSKAWASEALAEAPQAVLALGPLGLDWRLAHNTGAAFSLLADAGGWQRFFFIALSLAVCAALVWWLGRLPARAIGERLGVALIIGGALGNLLDRLRLGHVVDFIDVYWRHWHWPTFNLADSAITVGLLLASGYEIESSGEEAVEIVLGRGDWHPNLERALVGLPVGTEVTLLLDPANAFGEVDPSLLLTVDAEDLDPLLQDGAELEPGQVVEFATPNGSTVYARLLEPLPGGHWRADCNHVLAGQPITLVVTVDALQRAGAD